MQRRNFIAILGTAGASAATVLGTGAFTSVSAERSVTVAVEDDAYAFLRMEPNPDTGLNGENTGRSFTNGRQIKFEIPGDEAGENSNAEGVGVDSVYEFHDLVTITNQGTQPAILYSSYDGSNLADLALVNDEGVLRNDPPVLSIGEGINVGIYIDTRNSSAGEFNETLTIVAEDVSNN